MTTFTGGTGNDSFSGTTSADTFKLQQGGNDAATGDDGNDLFLLGATLNAADQLDGGAGNDTLSLNGDYSGGLTFNATTVGNIETITLAAGHSYNLTTNEATVAAGATLTVDASALGAGFSLIFNGLAERDGSFALTGGAGDDVLQGGDHEPNLGPAVTDTFNLKHGGNDQVTGGYNATNIANFGATFTAADQVLGASGAFGTMTVLLDGNYTGAGAVVFGANTIVNVDAIQLAGGHSYDLTTADANLGHGNRMKIDASALGASSVLTFDGSAETKGGAFDFIGGAGDDILTGSSSGSGPGNTFDLTRGGMDTVKGGFESDTFNFGATLRANDQIDGVGTDIPPFGDTVMLDGNYAGTHAFTFAPTTMINVEKLDLAGGNSYDLTTNDATVAAGAGLRVTATGLAAGETLTFDGSAETDGYFQIYAGAGNDVIQGGASHDYFDLHRGGTDTVSGLGGSDYFYMGGRLTAADHLDGGSGDDWLELDGNYASGVTLGASTLLSVESLVLDAGHNYTLTTADATVGSGKTLHVDGSALASTNTLVFDGAAETNGTFYILGGAGDDLLIGGAQTDFITPGAGNDTIHGGGGNDDIDFGDSNFTMADYVDGGAGDDTVDIGSDLGGPVTFSSATFFSVETVSLGLHSYDITTNDNLVAAGGLFGVSMSTGSTGNTLKFDGSAETDGRFDVEGGSGNDSIRTGANGDFLQGGGGADFLRGGDGADYYFYNAVSDSTGPGYDTIYGFNGHVDQFVMFGSPVGGMNGEVTTGTLSKSTFDSDLTAALAGHLSKHHAVLFTPDAGTLAGDTFLVVDANGNAGYQAGHDYVIRLQHGVHLDELAASDFQS